jgi:hypothetical protein
LNETVLIRDNLNFLDLDTKAQDGKYGPVSQLEFMMLLTPKTGHMSHMVTSHERRQMK